MAFQISISFTDEEFDELRNEYDGTESTSDLRDKLRDIMKDAVIPGE